MPRSGEIDEALRQIDIVSGERRSDFATGDGGVELCRRRALGDGRGIVLDREQSLRFHPARQQQGGGRRA